ncbi:hypothetical protein ACVWXM_007717 [Bradyrhizobium sp. GM7.3]
MTEWLDVSSTTPRIAYIATASQTVFTVPFVFFTNSDLNVYQNTVLLTLGAHYSVTGAESSSGRTVTLVTGATVGDQILITRDVPIEQTTHMPPSGPIDIPAINFQFSRLIAIDQQNADNIGRSIHFPDSDSTRSAELASATTRANKLLGFGSNGELIYPAWSEFCWRDRYRCCDRGQSGHRAGHDIRRERQRRLDCRTCGSRRWWRC